MWFYVKWIRFSCVFCRHFRFIYGEPVSYWTKVASSGTHNHVILYRFDVIIDSLGCSYVGQWKVQNKCTSVSYQYSKIYLLYKTFRKLCLHATDILELSSFYELFLFTRPFGSWSIIAVILELCRFSGVDIFTLPINTVYANRIRRPSIVSRLSRWFVRIAISYAVKPILSRQRPTFPEYEL
jgi:hypothetical protein